MNTASDDDRAKPWPRRKQEMAAVLWPSFLVACVATMVFFALFDPLLLSVDDQPPAWLQSRMTGYALGFFFFWIVAAAAAALTAYLIDTIQIDSNNSTSGDSQLNERKPGSPS
jgi:hypothetical protein